MLACFRVQNFQHFIHMKDCAWSLWSCKEHIWSPDQDFLSEDFLKINQQIFSEVQRMELESFRFFCRIKIHLSSLHLLDHSFLVSFPSIMNPLFKDLIIWFWTAGFESKYQSFYFSSIFCVPLRLFQGSQRYLESLVWINYFLIFFREFFSFEGDVELTSKPTRDLKL